MHRAPQPIRYLSEIRLPRVVLWCYFIWYVCTVIHHFDPAPRLWLNSLGISAVIGVALMLSVNTAGRDPWQIVRLFLMPLCVSSFSSLTKNQGFILIFPPDLMEFAISAGACAAFVITVFFIKRTQPAQPPLIA